MARREIQLFAAALAAGSSVLAQQPAAVLLPARSVPTPANVVIRSATPYAIPTAPMDSVPAVTTAPKQQSWAATQWNGLKSFVSSSVDSKPYQPFPDPNAKAGTQLRPNPQAPRTQQPTALQQPQTPSGVYAGPPAYRWYGWGSCTPGANPYAPTGVYPRASANWYTQTGATPGAFPVPVNYPPREIPGTEPPAYTADANRPIPDMQQIPVTSRPEQPQVPTTQTFTPPILSTTPTVAMPMPMGPTAIATTPPTVTPPVVNPTPAMPSELANMPMQAPEPVVETPPLETLNWMAGSKPDVPLKTDPIPAPVPHSGESGPSWERGKPLPTPTVIRSSFRDETPNIESAIRTACADKVRRVDVTHTSGKELVVRFLVESADHAREAAVRVVQLSEAKDYQIKFEAVIVTK